MSQLVDAAHDEAWEILSIHRSVLDRLAEALIEHETVDGQMLDEILEGIGGAAPDTPGEATQRPPSTPAPKPAEQMRAEGME